MGYSVSWYALIVPSAHDPQKFCKNIESHGGWEKFPRPRYVPDTYAEPDADDAITVERRASIAEYKAAHCARCALFSHGPFWFPDLLDRLTSYPRSHFSSPFCYIHFGLGSNRMPLALRFDSSIEEYGQSDLERIDREIGRAPPDEELGFEHLMALQSTRQLRNFLADWLGQPNVSILYENDN